MKGAFFVASRSGVRPRFLVRSSKSWTLAGRPSATACCGDRCVCGRRQFAQMPHTGNKGWYFWHSGIQRPPLQMLRGGLQSCSQSCALGGLHDPGKQDPLFRLPAPHVKHPAERASWRVTFLESAVAQCVCLPQRALSAKPHAQVQVHDCVAKKNPKKSWVFGHSSGLF